MSRRNPPQITDKFVYVTLPMLFSDAFKELKSSSALAYLLIKSQMKHKDDTEIVCPYSFITPFMQKKTFARAIRQLEDFGFIRRRQRGGLYRRTNIFSLSNDWKTFKKTHSLVNSKWGVEKHTVKTAIDSVEKHTPKAQKGKIISISGVEKHTTHGVQKAT